MGSELRRRDTSSAPVVDVAITAYRHARYVGEAIESVVAQTCGDWRLTIFENGPGGGEIERAVAPYLSDPRVAHRASGTELTVDANFTRAIRHGTGEYVALLHDDDRWHPEFLATRIAALDANPECAFAFSGWVQMDEHGVAGELSPLRFAPGVVSCAALARVLVHRNPIVASAAVVRRSAYEAVGAAFERRWLFCDWEMWARLAAQFPAFYLARRDTDFRRHLQSNTFATREQPEPLLELADHIERLLAPHLDSQRRGRIERARRRSRILLRAASDVHSGGGWRVSGALYRRALREHPPTIMHRRSLRMLSYTVVGRSTAVALAGIGRGWLRALTRVADASRRALRRRAAL
jgi:glycosyltransferase involved in cell wall biosynthesis